MCLIIFSFKESEEKPLVVCANRDEFYSRQTTSLDIWTDKPDIIAGRDLKAGGTWMGINKKTGKFAAITNYRDLKLVKENVKSRGDIVSNFLENGSLLSEFIETLKKEKDQYNGYNLIFGNKDSLFYYSNINDNLKEIEPGLHGVSNHFLDTPWPKLVKAKQIFKKNFYSNNLKNKCFNLLSDKEFFPEKDLPETGMGLEWEKLLSPIFIKSDIYGTRSSSFIAFHENGNIDISEKAYIEEGCVKTTEFEICD